MNLLLLEGRELAEVDGPRFRASLADDRLNHLRSVLGAEVGQELRVGLLGGALGTAEIESLDQQQVTLAGVFDQPPPGALEVDLVLALPRPPMLRRILEASSAMGVKRIVLLHSARVEKSYWQSHVLAPEAIERHLRLGLEQAVDTVPPEVELARRFRPFVEDRLPELLAGREGLVADPSFDAPCPRVGEIGPAVMVVGPEGGFVPFELGLLETAGLRGVGLGQRILRVEHATIALLALLGRTA